MIHYLHGEVGQTKETIKGRRKKPNPAPAGEPGAPYLAAGLPELPFLEQRNLDTGEEEGWGSSVGTPAALQAIPKLSAVLAPTQLHPALP